MSELNMYFYKINYMSWLKCSIITGIGKAHRQLYVRIFINTFIEIREKVDDVPCRYL